MHGFSTVVRARLRRALVSGLFAAVIPIAAFGQGDVPTEVKGSPFSPPPVLDAPFSADATTILRQTLDDGSFIERVVNARYYRDRLGRVRVEQSVIGSIPSGVRPSLRNVKTATGPVRIAISPGDNPLTVFWLDRSARRAYRGARSLAGIAVGGGNSFAFPVEANRPDEFSRCICSIVFYRAQNFLNGWLGSQVVEDEPLGSRQMAGLDVSGRRVAVTLPFDQYGNRGVDIEDERWESPELKILIYARSSDPRTGLIEYRVTNIRREEPPADLFVVPSDYTVDNSRAIGLIFGDGSSSKANPVDGINR
jgi:hypothetical protein